MIKTFVNRFMAAKPTLEAEWRTQQPDDYDALVKRLVEIVGHGQDDYSEDKPDAGRITIIDYGQYQGTRLYVIGAKGYQPSVYWSIFVDYGSCSGCDTLEALRGYSDDPVTDEQVNGYWTLMLHMVQSMSRIDQPESADAVDPHDGTRTG